MHVLLVYHKCLSTGWRRPIGCLKLQVIFCKIATNYRALLRCPITKTSNRLRHALCLPFLCVVNVYCHACSFRVGWLWLVGSIKLNVSFAKEPCKRGAILQKRPVILSILLTVATP